MGEWAANNLKAYAGVQKDHRTHVRVKIDPGTVYRFFKNPFHRQHRIPFNHFLVRALKELQRAGSTEKVL